MPITLEERRSIAGLGVGRVLAASNYTFVAGCVPPRSGHEIGRERKALVVLNDADNHRSRVSTDHRVAPAFDVQDVSSRGQV